MTFFLATLTAVVLSEEPPLDIYKLEAHTGGAQSGNNKDCHNMDSPQSWWDELKKRGINAGSIEHMEKYEVPAMMEWYKSLDVSKWPENWKKQWGDPKKLCNWQAAGMGPPLWNGLDCLINPYSPPPPKSNGGHIKDIRIPSGLLSGPLPAGFKYLVGLSNLMVAKNKLTGSFPDTGMWVLMQVFDISQNEFSGTLPDNFLTSPCTQTINIAHNKFEGTIPKSLHSRTVLFSLKLDNNQFSGTIPDFHDMPFLRELDLSNNKFSGTLPTSLTKLTTLKWLKLHQNKFSGPIPSQIDALSELSVLSVRGNDDMDKNIPDSVSHLALRVFNGTTDMKCSSDTLLRYVPETTSCGGRAIGSSQGKWLPEFDSFKG